MKKIKILVFLCGSEVGLEIYRSRRYCIHIELWGRISAADHGQLVFNNCFDNIPYIDDSNFIPSFKSIINIQSIAEYCFNSKNLYLN